MEGKKNASGTLRAYLIALPAILVSILALAVILLRLVFEEAAWLTVLAWAAGGLAAVNPGVLLLLVPLRGYLSKTAGGYAVAEAVTMEGVGRDTLDRCAAIAEAKATHPIGACLRAYCGDVAAPPDKFVEMEGLGASAQFSNQLIHAGSAEYMRGLKVEVPELPGRNAFIALEGRLLGYYRLLGPSETGPLNTRLTCAIAVCAVLKIAVWAALAWAGTDHMTIFVGCETVAPVIGLTAARKML